jgi:septal ring factor EnvC (AmiA/AmiB activator)
VTGPIADPPLEALPPDAAATVEDVRASRRWTWVALAWAIAASAIAVIALVQSSNDNTKSTPPTQTTQNLTPKLNQFEQQTNDRLDAFSGRLNDRAAEADLQKLGKRLAQTQDDLSQAKDDISKQSDTISQQQSDIKDLQQRVNDLENQQGGSGAGQGTSTTP